MESRNNKSNEFSFAPEEASLHVLTFLDVRSLSALSRTDKFFYRLCHDETLRTSDRLLKLSLDDIRRLLLQDLYRRYVKRDHSFFGKLKRGFDLFEDSDHRKRIETLAHDIKIIGDTQKLTYRNILGCSPNEKFGLLGVYYFNEFPFQFSICTGYTISNMQGMKTPVLLGGNVDNSDNAIRLRLIFRLQNEITYAKDVNNEAYKEILSTMMGAVIDNMREDELQACKIKIANMLIAAGVKQQRYHIDSSMVAAFQSIMTTLQDSQKSIEAKLNKCLIKYESAMRVRMSS